MKKFIVTGALVVLLLMLAGPVLAASLGISPSHIELEVPGDSSTTADLQVHYFSGDVKVDMVDIPLRVEPETLHVDALDEPADIQLTIYGDESLGSQVYDGYIKFIGMSGDMVAIAVQVRAKVTNIVEGQPVPKAEPEAESTESPATPEQSGEKAGLSRNTVIIIAAVVVFLGLMIIAFSLGARRRY